MPLLQRNRCDSVRFADLSSTAGPDPVHFPALTSTPGHDPVDFADLASMKPARASTGLASEYAPGIKK